MSAGSSHSGPHSAAGHPHRRASAAVRAAQPTAAAGWTRRLSELRGSLGTSSFTHAEAVALKAILLGAAADLDTRLARGQSNVSGPFRLLHGSGLIRTIAELLSPGDAMCAACSCRTLRDAVFEGGAGLTAEEMRQEEEDAADGHVRSRRFGDAATDPAAHVHSLSRFRWARSMGGLRRTRSRSPAVCNAAARAGSLAVLREARSLGYSWDETTMEAAAREGQLAVLQFARSLPPKERCPWDEDTCAAAAAAGSIEVLRWARQRRAPWDERTCIEAAAHGHLHVLQWARKNACPWDSTVAVAAVEEGQAECFFWAMEHGERSL